MKWKEKWRPQMVEEWRMGRFVFRVDLYWTIVVWAAVAGLAVCLWLGDWRIVL